MRYRSLRLKDVLQSGHIGYISTFWKEINKTVLLAAAFFIGVAIYLNYHFGLNSWVNNQSEPVQYLYWYGVFLAAFSLPYLLYFLTGRHRLPQSPQFVALLLLAPAIFSWKMVADVQVHFSSRATENAYWNQVFYWPFKLAVMIAVLFLTWKLTGDRDSFYGLTARQFKPKPYLLMLLFMVPLIAAASTQSDFLAMYPRLQHNTFLHTTPHRAWYTILYELSYGSDFISIELFFRGFLVLAFVRWFGADAILPMACFYCTIHFGKPLGECISSFFGGMILGVVTWRTRTILGGLMVHLGIAWLMELGGFLGHSWTEQLGTAFS